MTCAYLVKRSQRMEFSTDKAPYPFRDQLYPQPAQVPSRNIPDSMESRHDIPSSVGAENVPALGEIQMSSIPNLEKHLLNAQKALSDTRIYNCDSSSIPNEEITSDVKIPDEIPQDEGNENDKLDIMDLFGKSDRDERIKAVETDWAESLSRPKPAVSRPTATVPPQRSSPARQSPARPKRKGPIARVSERAHNTPPPIRFQIASHRNQAAPPLVRSALDAEDSDSDTDDSQEDIRMTSTGSESRRESTGRSREDSESRISRSSRSNSPSGSSSREIPRSVTPDPDIAEMFGSQDVDLRNLDSDRRSLDESQSSSQDLDLPLRDIDMRVQSQGPNDDVRVNDILTQSGVLSSAPPSSGPPLVFPGGGPPRIPTPDLSLPPPPLVRPLLTRPTLQPPSMPPPSVPPSGGRNIASSAGTQNLPPHSIQLSTPPPFNPLLSNPTFSQAPPQNLLSSIPVISQACTAAPINTLSPFSRPPPPINPGMTSGISNIQDNGPALHGQIPPRQQIPMNQNSLHGPIRTPSPSGFNVRPTQPMPGISLQGMTLPDLSREPPLPGRASSPVWAPPSSQHGTSPMPMFPNTNHMGEIPPQRTSPLMFPMSSQERPPFENQRSSPLHFAHDHARSFQPIIGEQRFDAYRPNFPQGPPQILRDNYSSPSHIPVHHPSPQSGMGRPPSPDIYRQNTPGRQNLKPITPIDLHNTQMPQPSEAEKVASDRNSDKKPDVYEEYVPTSPTCASPEPANEVIYVPTSKSITDRRGSGESNSPGKSTDSSPETSGGKEVEEERSNEMEDKSDAVEELVAGEQSNASKVTKRKASFDMFDFGEDASKKKIDDDNEGKSPDQAKVAKLENKTETPQKYDEEVLLEKVPII